MTTTTTIDEDDVPFSSLAEIMMMYGMDRVQKGKKSKSAAKERPSRGGWDKCLGPFTKSEASEYGVDVWKCRSYCYTRRDPNGGN